VSRFIKASVCLIFVFSGDAFPAPLSNTIYAGTDGFHTFIVLPVSNPDSLIRYLKYEYAEKAWYLEGKSSYWRALFVLISHHKGTVGEYPLQSLSQAGGDTLIGFPVSEENYGRASAEIESWIQRNRIFAKYPDAVFYGSTRSYWLFNTCHHFTLSALKAADIPVHPARAFTNSGAMRQIKRAAKRGK
jgi:hypothetical protein